MAGTEEEVKRVLAALKTGIELESKGLNFYTKASERVMDPRGKQTLVFLANEEKDHLKYLRGLLESFEKKSSKFMDIVEAKKERDKKPKVFPEMENYLEEVRDIKGDKKILEEAAEIEKRSIAFYRESGEGVKGRDSRKIFDLLVKEEEEHLKLIEQMDDYMVLTGVWSGLEDYFANE